MPEPVRAEPIVQSVVPEPEPVVEEPVQEESEPVPEPEMVQQGNCPRDKNCSKNYNFILEEPEPVQAEPVPVPEVPIEQVQEEESKPVPVQQSNAPMSWAARMRSNTANQSPVAPPPVQAAPGKFIDPRIGDILEFWHFVWLRLLV